MSPQQPRRIAQRGAIGGHHAGVGQLAWQRRDADVASAAQVHLAEPARPPRRRQPLRSRRQRPIDADDSACRARPSARATRELAPSAAITIGARRRHGRSPRASSTPLTPPVVDDRPLHQHAFLDAGTRRARGRQERVRPAGAARSCAPAARRRSGLRQRTPDSLVTIMPSTGSAPSTAAATPRRVRMASAPGLTESPQSLKRGNRARSSTRTRTPARASTSAAIAPAGPAPTTSTSWSGKTVFLSLSAGPHPRRLPALRFARAGGYGRQPTWGTLCSRGPTPTTLPALRFARAGGYGRQPAWGAFRTPPPSARAAGAADSTFVAHLTFIPRRLALLPAFGLHLSMRLGPTPKRSRAAASRLARAAGAAAS